MSAPKFLTSAVQQWGVGLRVQGFRDIWELQNIQLPSFLEKLGVSSPDVLGTSNLLRVALPGYDYCYALGPADQVNYSRHVQEVTA